jgi:hypothetical protein
MHVYRNRRYEEEIVMLMWHREREQRMVETSEQKTQIQAKKEGKYGTSNDACMYTGTEDTMMKRK